MTALANQRGTALVAALGVAMILVPLGGLVALQCRTDLSIQHNLRSDVEAFYVADAGLNHAVAEIPPGRTFDSLLAGPDQVLGTTDDGAFPFLDGPPAAFPYPPFRYDVQVASVGADRLRIISHATGANGSEKVVEALVARNPLPFTPAALYRETANLYATVGTSFGLSGIDHQPVIPPIPEPQPKPPVLASGTASATAPRLHVEDYAASVAATPNAATYSSAPVDNATWGTRTAPQLSIVNGDLTVSGRLSGCGILVVRGTFEVSGTVEFSGMVLALGAVLFDAPSSVTIVGTLWQSASQDERLQLAGNGVVAYSSGMLSDLDRAFPGLLPHAAVVRGWQEQV